MYLKWAARSCSGWVSIATILNFGPAFKWGDNPLVNYFRWGFVQSVIPVLMMI
jgi:hypothetical protein